MRKVFLLSFLLLFGLFISQYLPIISFSYYSEVQFVIKYITMVCLSYIMIHVGMEFSFKKERFAEYGWDYVVAFTAAFIPWILCTLYFFYAYDHDPNEKAANLWFDALLLGRFASPTSAEILFSMLAAMGLSASWVFKKIRILAVFDDIDTVFLLIPIKFLVVGFSWSLVFLVLAPALLMLIFGWKKMHSICLPLHWKWVLFYSVFIVTFLKIFYLVFGDAEGVTSVPLEVILPAFILGTVATTKNGREEVLTILERKEEKWVSNSIAILFIALVGASMPAIGHIAQENGEVSFIHQGWLNYKIGSVTVSRIMIDVLCITLLSNIGKMSPIFFYRKEAKLWQRVALAFGMCPRGEVGAGILLISLSLVEHLDSALIIVATFSLAFNFLLTPPIIFFVFKLHQWFDPKSIQHHLV